MVLRAQLALLSLACLSSTALGAIHSYNKEYFYAVGDAFIFRGGREGLYASTKEVSATLHRLKAKSDELPLGVLSYTFGEDGYAVLKAKCSLKSKACRALTRLLYV